jgi:hypothetical protein
MAALQRPTHMGQSQDVSAPALVGATCPDSVENDRRQRSLNLLILIQMLGKESNPTLTRSLQRANQRARLTPSRAKVPTPPAPLHPAPRPHGTDSPPLLACRCRCLRPAAPPSGRPDSAITAGENQHPAVRAQPACTSRQGSSMTGRDPKVPDVLRYVSRQRVASEAGLTSLRGRSREDCSEVPAPVTHAWTR